MLTGSSVCLRAWREEDIPFFHTLRNDFTTQLTLLAEPHPQTIEHVRGWLERRNSSHDDVFFVIADLESNQPEGFVELRSLRPIHRWGQLGICIASAFRGRNRGKEALALLEQFAFDVLAIRKIVLDVLASNAQALRLYKGADYRQVGIHQSHFWHQGQFHDVILLEKQLTGSRRAATL